MADKYLKQSGGGLAEQEATVSSTGAGSAGRIPALDAAGLLAQNMMPAGVGPSLETLQASENLAAGALVNFHVVSGNARVRNADASSNKPADGFVLAAVTSGANADVYRSGRDTGVTGLTVGEQFLSTTPGAATTTPPSGSGQIVQRVGFASAATSLSFARGVPVQLA